MYFWWELVEASHIIQITVDTFDLAMLWFQRLQRIYLKSKLSIYTTLFQSPSRVFNDFLEHLETFEMASYRLLKNL